MNSEFDRAGYFEVSADSIPAANRSWWDSQAREYLAEHGDFLGEADLIWGPEGISEDAVAHLGDVRGLRVIEVGSGAAQGGRWASAAGADAVSVDLSAGMLAAGQQLSQRAGFGPQLVQADALALPFANASFDLAFSAYGAIPFVTDLELLHREVFRVLKPGGRWVFSTTHPIRWAFPDVPTEAGLTANRSYFDRTPYSEMDSDGGVIYAEYHRTMADHVRMLRAVNFQIEALEEPAWPEENTQEWGGWSPTRGRIIPGTIIVTASKPGS